MITQVWSCGGGTQSAAIAALIIEGKLPKPDYAVMADTGREKSSTWRYVNGVLIPSLAGVGVTLHVAAKAKYGTVDLFSKDTLLIPAYTNLSGETSKLSGFCSDKWKVRVIGRWLREQGVIHSQAMQWLGFSTNELRRVRAGKFRYPLIMEFPMNREACHAYATQVLGVAPPRGGSACWNCPNLSDAQWVEMRESDPEDFDKACDLDEEIRQRDPNVFLHRSCKPLRLVTLGSPDQMTLSGCESGMCFV
jgi:hypothetical protein